MLVVGVWALLKTAILNSSGLACCSLEVPLRHGLFVGKQNRSTTAGTGCEITATHRVTNLPHMASQTCRMLARERMEVRARLLEPEMQREASRNKS